MSPLTAQSVLIVGVTGYIGGGVLDALVNHPDPSIRHLEISVLLRNASLTDHFKAQSEQPIPFSSLDDTTFLREIAASYDIIINCASGHHTASAQAFVQGLADRKRTTGSDPTYIHTSGTSNISDHPVTKGFVDQSIHSDHDDIYALLQQRESQVKYAQRATDLAVVDIGTELGVRTYILMLPNLFGLGPGVMKINQLMSPIIHGAIKSNQLTYIGDGDGIWAGVDVRDAARLYALLVGKVLAGDYPAAGKQGWFFCSALELDLKTWAERLAETGVKAGTLTTAEVASISLQELADSTGWPALILESLASNARVSADRAAELGWSPTKGINGWEEGWTEMYVEMFKQTSRAA